jgi:hypothetical protein
MMMMIGFLALGFLAYRQKKMLELRRSRPDQCRETPGPVFFLLSYRLYPIAVKQNRDCLQGAVPLKRARFAAVIGAARKINVGCATLVRTKRQTPSKRCFGASCTRVTALSRAWKFLDSPSTRHPRWRQPQRDRARQNSLIRSGRSYCHLIQGSDRQGAASVYARAINQITRLRAVWPPPLI